ncbi:diguanylate cyclase [Spirulina major]|uniref:diguanylate cyclase n=1 Tax=Spirulina major TaxID=270636 RepID=UPI0009338E93|nr:diguanylate cyclase [Spirulina major]
MTLTSFDPSHFLIMVVDDTPPNLKVMGSILESVGYKTTFAISGQQVLDRLATLKPDLILLDWMMPEMDGLEVCQKLQRHPDYSHIPIIFLTARQDRESCVQAFNSGAVDYITKPFNRSELLARVRTHLRLKDLSDRLQKSLTEVEILARTDSLTGILNRRSLFEFAAAEFQRAHRYDVIFSVIIFDVDHFKTVNDRYGHLIGDVVLKVIAAKVQSQLRSLDGFGRYGGEEFVIVLPESNLTAAATLGNRLCTSLSTLKLPDLDPAPQITASFGVATYTATDHSIDDLFSRADQALYYAKQAGRNCCYANITHPTSHHLNCTQLAQDCH